MPLSLPIRVAALLAALFTATTVRAEDASWLPSHLDELVAVYTHFHTHPELSYHEEQTAARLAKELADVGCEVTTDVGGHGVVGLLRNGDGPTLMLRTDLDALPVTEETGLEYASKVTTANEDGVEVGVMHACGHDVHITNQIAVARYLSSHKDEWSGTVMFIGQPAEEKGRRRDRHAGGRPVQAVSRGRTSPSPCMSTRFCRPGWSATAAAMRWPTSTAVTSPSTAGGDTGPTLRGASIRSPRRPSSSSICRRLSAAKSPRWSRRSSQSARSTGERSTTSSRTPAICS